MALPAIPAYAAPCSFTEDGNGDVIIAADCEVAAGTYNITSDFVVNSGVTITAQGNTGAGPV